MMRHLNGTIEVWSIRFCSVQPDVGLYRSLLSNDEIKRAVRCRRPEDAECFILARGLLRNILGHLLNAGPATLIFEKNKNGKPSLQKGGLEFNLSHSRDRLLIAAARGRTLGVDIEFHRKNLNFKAVVQRCFTPEEQAFFRNHSSPETAFFDLWAKKEAYVKACGEGIYSELNRCSVPPERNDYKPVPGPCGQWFFQMLDIDPSYSAAIVSEMPPVPVRLHKTAPPVRDQISPKKF